MKIIFVLLLFPFVGFSQKKLQGVGDFVIGTAVIDSLESITGLDMYKYNIYGTNALGLYYDEDDKLKTQRLGELYHGKKEDGYIIEPSNLPDNYRIARINYYAIADIDLRNLELIFFNDTLIRFKCDYKPEISQALEANYGKPKRDLTTKKLTCIYKLTGVKEILDETSVTEDWHDGSILAHVSIYDRYDDHCKKEIRSLFYVENTIKMHDYYNAMRKSRLTIQKEEKELDKTKYKKF